jgi:hypothetical protein
MIKKILFMIFLFLILISISRSDPVQVFWDSFEDEVMWSNWTEEGEGDWVIEARSTEITVDGSVVAHSDDCDTWCRLTTNVTIDLSPYDNATLKFNWGVKGLDSGEYLALHIYNGTWNENVWSNPKGTGAGTKEIDLSPYGMVSNLQIRFDTKQNLRVEYAEIDAINVTAWSYPPEVDTPKTYNETLEEDTTFERDEGMTVRVNVSDPGGEDKIDSVLITILNTTGNVKVDNATMTNISSITNGYTYEYNYTIPIDAEAGDWTIDIYANDTAGEWGSNTTTFEVIVFGYLEVSLISPDPATPTNVAQNSTFVVNATVYCRSGTCGNVNGTVRYNSSSLNPDTEISTAEGGEPFYIQEPPYPSQAMKECPTNPLDVNEFCNLTWTVNATGNIDTGWKIGVLFNSSESSVEDNHTGNATVYITWCTEELSLGWSEISFSSLFPGTIDNNATGNDNDLYNLTNSGTCVLDVWIKGEDLINQTLGSEIAVGNLSWSNSTNNPASSFNLTSSYVLMKDDLQPGVNLTSYYWLDVPPIYAGIYLGNITFCGNYTGVCM